MRAAALGDFWRLLGRAIDRESIMAGEAVTAMIVADDGGDDPLADRREDREAAAERERKAKVAKLNSQTVNAMEVVRAQQAAKEQGAFDEPAYLIYEHNMDISNTVIIYPFLPSHSQVSCVMVGRLY